MNNPGHSCYGASPTPSQGAPSPDCCGAESQPMFCLAPACLMLLPFFSGLYLFIYTVNVIKLQQEMEAIPCHSPQASPGPVNKEAHCAAWSLLPARACG